MGINSLNWCVCCLSRVMYDRSTQFWSLLLSVLKSLPPLKTGGKGKGRDMRGGLYWAAHQRFYKGLLIAAKVRVRGFSQGLLIAAKVRVRGLSLVTTCGSHAEVLTMHCVEQDEPNLMSVLQIER